MRGHALLMRVTPYDDSKISSESNSHLEGKVH